MKISKIAFIFILGSLVLAACAGSRVAAQAVVNTPASACSTPAANKVAVCQAHQTPTAVPEVVQPAAPAAADMMRSDAQGNVTVEVTPERLNAPKDSLVFDIGMNTHMVDLGMDLAKLATLSTNTGQTVQAMQWDAQKGGHHVSGKLIFPAVVNGKPILDGASSITLMIKGVDAPERLFTWQLPQ